MPTYEYHCQTCGKNFDLFQSMKDVALTTCPKEKCQMAEWGQGTIKRQLGTGAGLIFKGSGFYITDYRSAGYQEAAKKDKPPTESKPEAKSESKAAPASTPAPAAEKKAPKAD